MQDLNIKPRNNEKERCILIRRLFELGWDRIAWNTTANGKLTNNTQTKSIKQVQLSHMDILECKSSRSLVTSNQNTQIQQYNRITLTIDELVDAQQLTAGNEYLKSFDIVSVCPGNAKIFSFLCKTAQIDVISINFAHKIPFTLNKKLLDEAISRGIFFEIVFSPLLSTPQMRREIMSGTRVFVQFLRGRHILLTSGADCPAQARGPFDAVNIGQILKMTSAQALDAISTNAIEMLKHCNARRLKFLPLEVLSVDSYENKWSESNVFSSQRTETRIDTKRKQPLLPSQRHISDCEDSDLEDDTSASDAKGDVDLNVGSFKRARVENLLTTTIPETSLVNSMSDTDDFIKF